MSTAEETINPLPSAGESFLSTLRTFLNQEDADRYALAFSDFVQAGGIHATAAGLVGTPSALTAFAAGFIVTESGSITYGDNTTTWVIADAQIIGSLGVYARVTGTHYLTRAATADPGLPTGAIRLMRVTTAGGAITAVVDLRNRTPISIGAASGTFVVVGPPTGIDDTATVQAAITDAVASGVKGVLFRQSDVDYVIDTITIATDDLQFIGIGAPVIRQRTNTVYRIFVVTGDRVSFEGLTFDGASSAYTVTPLGMVEHTGTTGGRVSRCTFQNTGSDAVGFLTSDHSTVESCTVTACARGINFNNTGGAAHAYANAALFNRLTALTDATVGYGIQIAATDAARQVGFRVIGNYVDSPLLLQAISVYRGGFDGTIALNTCNYAGWGISLAHGFNCTVIGNSVRGNASFGIELAEGCEDCTVIGNVVDGRNAAGTAVCVTGILLASTPGSAPFDAGKNNLLTGNLVRYGAAASVGIHIYTIRTSVLSGNHVEGFTTNIYLQETDGISITGGRSLGALGGVGNLISVENTAFDNNGLLVSGVRLSGACTNGIRLSATTFFINDAFITGLNTSGLVAAGSGLNMVTVTQIVNLRVGLNHSTSPTDSQRSIGSEIKAIAATNYVVLEDDHTVLCNDGAGSYSVTLPSAVNRAGRIYTFKKATGSAAAAVITAAAGQLIDDSLTFSLVTIRHAITVQSDNSRWQIIAKVT